MVAFFVNPFQELIAHFAVRQDQLSGSVVLYATAAGIECHFEVAKTDR